MATAEQRPHLNIRPARGDDAPALRDIFNDAVEEGFATFDSSLRSIEEQKRLIAMAEEDSRRPLFRHCDRSNERRSFPRLAAQQTSHRHKHNFLQRVL